MQNCVPAAENFEQKIAQIQAQKRDLRREILRERQNLPNAEAKHLAKIAIEKLAGTPIFGNVKIIASFVSFGNEISTRPLFEKILRERENCEKNAKKICAPRVCGNEISLFEIRDFSRDLRPQSFGILEPTENCVPVDSAFPQIHIIPGAAFDFHGNRIGYGRGFYDRFLARVPATAITIGFCFDFQLLPTVPAAAFDVPVKFLLTPARGLFAAERER